MKLVYTRQCPCGEGRPNELHLDCDSAWETEHILTNATGEVVHRKICSDWDCKDMIKIKQRLEAA